MKKTDKNHSTLLRQKAEVLLNTSACNRVSSGAAVPFSEVESLRLIHELEVHQIELELINEELLLGKQQAVLDVEKYTSLYDFAPSGYFTLSADGKILELNPAGARMLGKERVHLQNNRFGYFVSGGSMQAFNHFLAAAFRDTANVTCEVALNVNGRIPMFVSLTGTRDKSGKRCLMTAVDISERRQDEELLRRKEHDLSESQRIAHVGSWRLDLATNEVIWTKELYNMYGFDPSIPPPPYTEHMKLFTPESWERLSIALAHTRETGIPYTLELETIRKDGTNRWMWVRGEAEADQTGKTVALWGAVQDITERKIAENEILWRSDDLQLMNNITVAANNNEDLGSIIEIISTQLRKTFNSHLISIFLPDVENREMRMYGSKLDNELIPKIEKLTGRAIPQIRLKMDGENPFTEIERSLTGMLFVGKKAVVNRLAGYLKGTLWPVVVQKFVKKLLPILYDLFDYQSSVAVPLISNGIITGYLELGSRKILTDHDLNRIQAIANQLASVIAQNESNKKLRESEERMSSAFNFAAIGMAFVSPDGRWLKVNAAVSEMLGYTEAELISKTFQEITHPDDLFKDLDYVRQMLEGTIQTYQIEKRYFHKSGAIIWVLLSVSLVHDALGQPVHFISQIQDITERVQAIEKLKESESKYRLLAENTTDGILIIDADAKIKYVSPGYIKQLGYSEQEELSRNYETIYKIIHPEDRDNVFASIFRAIEEKKSELTYCYRVKKNNGQFFWREDNAKFNYDSDKNHVDTYVVCRDITERKNAENVLKETLKQLNQANHHLEERVEERTKEILEISGFQKAILENVPIAIMTIDLEGIYQSINPAGEKMLGYSADEVIGKLNPFSFHDKNEMLSICFERTAISNPTDEELFRAVLQYMFNKSTEWTWIRKNGEKFSVRITHSPIIDNNGVINGHIGLISDITLEKLAMESLRESQERFHKMFQEHAAIMLLINPEDGEILQANDTAGKFYGLDFAGNKTYIHEINALSQASLKEEMERAEKQQRNCFVFPHKLASGDIRTVEIHSTPIEVRGKKVLFSVIHDISERKEMEAALKMQSAAFESFTLAIIITDINGRIQWANSAFTQLTGYTVDEAIGKKPGELVKSEIQDKDFYKNFWDTILSKNVWSGELINRHKDGSLYYEEETISPVLDSLGNISSFIAIKIDITERKKLFQDIATEKRRLDDIIKGTNAGTWEWNIQSGETIFNERWAEILGYTLNEIAPASIETWMKFAHPEDLKVSDELLNKYFNGELPDYSFESRMRHKNGDWIWILDRGKVHEWDNDGKPLLMSGIHLDITLQKRIEEALTEAKTEAEKANQAKSEFLSRMSHELRTPMNSILGFAQMLEMGELKAAHKKGINHILKSGKHLLNLINEVLDIAGIEAGRVSLSLLPVESISLIREIIDTVYPLTSSKHVKIDLINEGNDAFFVKADPHRLRQVLLNLISNAVKYNRDGGSVTVKTELQQAIAPQITFVRISVNDTGCGINPEYIEKLFRPFERIGAEKTGIEGTGLGLMVVKKLMDAMGGRVGVESVPGEGSLFWIELPHIANQSAEAEKTEQSSVPLAMITEKTGTILYIEDDPSNTELVEQILLKHRPAIQLACGTKGAQAVPLAIEYAPDLILLDLDLPDIQGFDVFKRLQSEEKTKHIPVVVISADAMPQKIEKLTNAGSKDYLTKPLDVRAFLQVVDEFLKNKEDDKKNH